jgi:hypothetical protein
MLHAEEVYGGSFLSHCAALFVPSESGALLIPTTGGGI